MNLSQSLALAATALVTSVTGVKAQAPAASAIPTCTYTEVFKATTNLRRQPVILAFGQTKDKTKLIIRLNRSTCAADFSNTTDTPCTLKDIQRAETILLREDKDGSRSLVAAKNEKENCSVSFGTKTGNEDTSGLVFVKANEEYVPGIISPSKGWENILRSLQNSF